MKASSLYELSFVAVSVVVGDNVPNVMYKRKGLAAGVFFSPIIAAQNTGLIDGAYARCYYTAGGKCCSIVGSCNRGIYWSV
ncbi:hypothetical protein F4776DRAFT_648205, partial [Hypoxylon sp. NC0597]